MKFLSLFISVFFIFFQTACVSVGLPKHSVKRSESYTHKPPSSPFSERSGFNTDYVYQSQKTSNSIMVTTECGSRWEIPLEQLVSDSFSVLSNHDAYKIQYFDYNQRRALRSHTTGEVDGVKSFYSIVAFSKDGCSYVLSFVGAQRHYESEKTVFENFIQGFKVP